MRNGKKILSQVFGPQDSALEVFTSTYARVAQRIVTLCNGAPMYALMSQQTHTQIFFRFDRRSFLPSYLNTVGERFYIPRDFTMSDLRNWLLSLGTGDVVHVSGRLRISVLRTLLCQIAFGSVLSPQKLKFTLKAVSMRV